MAASVTAQLRRSDSAGVVLRRQVVPAAIPVVLDPDQARAVDCAEPLLRVLGAPGTGKTTVAIETVARAVHQGGLRADRCLLLTSSRAAAARLREAVTARLGAVTIEPLARTHQAFGFAILRREAALEGAPSPRLITGAEQDAVLRELLEGHRLGDRPGPTWPVELHPALTTAGFRGELRDLLMRAVEHGLTADGLAALGVARGRPEWVAAAQLLDEYDQVTALARPGGFDPAWVLTAAADLLEDDPGAEQRLGLDLVVVDDAQELTSAAARLLRVVARTGCRIVLLGDPDSAVQSFRGADPRFLAHDWSELGTGPTVVLSHGHRQPPELAAVTASVARRIGALGGGPQRAAVPAAHHQDPSAESNAGGPAVEVAMVRSAAQEAALIGERLRAAHLLGGRRWSEMAVVVRSRARMGALRRALAGTGIPVAAASAAVHLRDEPAVRGLAQLLDLAVRRHEDPAWHPHVETVLDLLASPLGATDPAAVRRLRRLLRAEERGSAGARSSDELLSLGIVEPQWTVALGPDGAGLRRLRTALDCAVALLDRCADESRVAAPDEVLWAVWDGLDLAASWERLALGGGSAGVRADRDLDAVLAVFQAAADFAERLPGAGVRTFLDHVLGQDVGSDSLVERAPVGDAVELATPVEAAGRQWRYVVVASVQEGSWPDLRLRGTLLGSEALVDLLAGRDSGHRAASAAIRYDETRLFHVAISRASERLLVTAVRSEDEQPSVFLDIVDPLAGAGPLDDDGQRTFTEPGAVLSLPAAVARLRRDLVSSAGADDAAAAILAELARRGIPGADPAMWWSRLGPSDDRPLVPDGESVRVSPSQVGDFGECGLRWLLTTRGASGPAVGSATIGSLVHALAHDLGHADAPTYVAALEERWPQLGLPRSWATAAQHDQARRMVTRLAAYLGDLAANGWESVATEVDLRAGVGRAVVTGRVDRLERRSADGALRVVDLKTGSGKPSAAELGRHAQLGVYQVAVEAGGFADLGRVCAGAALVQLGKAAGNAASVQHQMPLAEDPDDPHWAAALLAAAADGMAAAEVVAARSPGCRRCPVRTSCPLQTEGGRL
jgi:superfamily I DNA/RNA helicase/RecB family exonuclease